VCQNHQNVCFCLEHESIHHQFFDCVIAKFVWHTFFCFSGVKIDSYIDLASKWPCEKNHAPTPTNSISAGILWGLWLIRNDFVFNHQVWRDVKVMLRRIWLCIWWTGNLSLKRIWSKVWHNGVFS
jgi:hypothetical protein